MSDTIKKVVELTEKQWIQLLETGQTTDSNGNIHYYDESGETLYNANKYNEIIALNNKIDRALINKNILSTDRNIRRNLADELAYLICEYPELKNRGAVGLKIQLRPNDTIIINPSEETYERVYLNGVERGTNYTYDGEHSEVVTVWYFANLKVDIQLMDATRLNIIDIYIKVADQRVNLHATYRNSVINGTIDGDTSLILSYCKYYRDINSATTYIAPLGKITYYSEAKRLTTAYTFVSSSDPYLEIIDFPLLTEIKFSSGNASIIVSPNDYCRINLSSLVSLEHTWGGSTNGIFSGFNYFKFPSTIRSIGQRALSSIKSLDLTEANEAKFYNSWYSGNPCNIIEVADNWKQSINLSVAGKLLGLQWYLDLFNKLAVVETTQSLTIPSEIYNQLSTEQKAIVTNKNWSLGGA